LFDLKLAPEGLQFEFDNKGMLKVEALGTAKLNCVTPEGIQEVLLKNGRLVLGVGVNLASLTKMLEGGAEIQGSGSKIDLLFHEEIVMQAIRQFADHSGRGERSSILCRRRTKS
jgi:hypothetical protein